MRVACTACGAEVDPTRALPFACPEARAGDDIDHVLARTLPDATPLVASDHPNPFIRYRKRLLAWHVATANGLSDEGFATLVEALDAALQRVDGQGFRVTPFAPSATLAAEAGSAGRTLWVKDETGNVAGSHKARHLMAVLLYLRVAEEARFPVAEGLRARPLAIASCGNAALAAATLARAADWPIDVFIPTDAGPAVVARLRELGARIHVCPRDESVPGDPCVAAYRAAVAKGAIPFGVQGNENGLAVEGGRTLGWEIAEGLAAARAGIDSLFIQVGGGALASGCVHGLIEAAALGLPVRLPRLVTVQTRGAWPLNRAYERFVERHGRPTGPALDTALQRAARPRSAYMWPWETPPRSIAHGILDDETYDWRDVVGHLVRSGGHPVIASEDDLERAHHLARAAGFNASHTGSAGLAGLLADRATGRDIGAAAVLMTGVDR